MNKYVSPIVSLKTVSVRSSFIVSTTSAAQLGELATPTLMAQEMAEQPAALQRTMQQLPGELAGLQQLTRGRRHLRFAARGTSDNAAVHGRYLAEAFAGIPSSLAAVSIVTHYQRVLPLDDTIFVALSQSGSTAEIVAAQAAARAGGAVTIAVTNTAGSALAVDADLALITSAGAERAVPATKTFTTQLLAMTLLVDALAPGLVSDDELHNLPAAVTRVLSSAATPASAAAAGIAERGDQVVVVSRGLALAAALEIGLKLEETCLRPVRGLSSADFEHGPTAVLSPGTTLIVPAPAQGAMLTSLTSLVRTAQAAGAHVIGIGGDTTFAESGVEHIPGGENVSEVLSPITLTVAGQLIAEALSRALGHNPDSPRGLSKITQTTA